jgi:hypothetical protein
MYLKVSISDFLTLFSSRTVGWFWSSRPGNMLLGGAGLALSLSTALACAWPKGELHEIEVEGLALGEYRLWPLWVWLYCIVWWFIQDACKVLTYKIVEMFNLFDYNTEGLVNMRAAHKADDPKHKLARVSVGMVEGKLLQMKVRRRGPPVQPLRAAAAGCCRRRARPPAHRQRRLSRRSPGGQRPPLHRQDGAVRHRPQHPVARLPGDGAHRRPGPHLRRPRRRRRCAPAAPAALPHAAHCQLQQRPPCSQQQRRG